MKFVPTQCFFILLISSVFVHSEAQAAEGNRFITDLRYGALRYDVTAADFETELSDGSLTSNNVDKQSNHFALSFGWRFCERLTAELGYASLGTVHYRGASDGSGTLYFPGPVRSISYVDGYTLALSGRWDIRGRWDIEARFGWIDWQVDTDIKVVGAKLFQRDEGTEIFVAIGLGYALSDNVGLLAEYRAYGEDLAAEALSFGLRLAF